MDQLESKKCRKKLVDRRNCKGRQCNSKNTVVNSH